MSESEKKIASDEGWKEAAQHEKEELGGGATVGGPAAGAPAGEKSEEPARERPPLLPASFELIVEEYMTQILLALGAMPHPVTGKRGRDLAVAKHFVDTLGVLQEKTKGNLTAEEQQLLDGSLYQARMTYVQTAKAKG